MSKDNKDNIVDTTKPSAGRIYDYILGGNHNFEVDRQTADYLINLMPFLTKIVRLQRWTLQDIAVELTQRRGYDVIIDFASGLPTSDHIHPNVPKGTTVIYSDFDPVVVEYARDILQNTPDVYYFEADAREPEELLNRPEVLKILGDRRRVAIAFWGVSAFLRDEEVSRSLRALYDWSAPGSCLALNAQGVGTNPNDPAVVELYEIYARNGQPGYHRTLEKFIELCGDWRLDDKGFISLLNWHGFDQSELGKEEVSIWGPLGPGFGAYLTK